MKKIIVISLILVVNISAVFSQCVNCDPNSTATGNNSTALGEGTNASGNASFASGAFSSAEGYSSISMGFRNRSEESYSISIGGFAYAKANESIVIGHGVTESDMLINPYSYSLMIGFGSTKPTLFVGTSPNSSSTGKIGIGDITIPQAKLHLLSDEGEPAAIFIEPRNWGEGEYSSLILGSTESGIKANSMDGMNFLSEGNYFFNSGGFVGINTAKPEYNLHVEGSTFTTSFRMYDAHLPPKEGYVMVSDDLGNAYWANPSESGLWKLSENGTDIYRTIGNVGIGTTNTGEYKLAVNGNMVAELIQVVGDVPASDYVFKEGYKLMTLYELEKFVKMNHHLPEVKSAQEFQDKGYSVGEMDDVLLRKVEELTLYTIEQQKQIDKQQETVNMLLQQVNELKEKLNSSTN